MRVGTFACVGIVCGLIVSIGCTAGQVDTGPYQLPTRRDPPVATYQRPPGAGRDPPGGTYQPAPGSGPRSSCPVCGRYKCTEVVSGQTATFTIVLDANTDGSCSTAADQVVLTVACDGTFSASPGATGTWVMDGANLVLSSTDVSLVCTPAAEPTPQPGTAVDAG